MPTFTTHGTVLGSQTITVESGADGISLVWSFQGGNKSLSWQTVLDYGITAGVITEANRLIPRHAENTQPATSYALWLSSIHGFRLPLVGDPSQVLALTVMNPASFHRTDDPNGGYHDPVIDPTQPFTFRFTGQPKAGFTRDRFGNPVLPRTSSWNFVFSSQIHPLAEWLAQIAKL